MEMKELERMSAESAVIQLTVASTRLAWNDASAFSRIGDLFIRLSDFFEKRIGLDDRLIFFRTFTFRLRSVTTLTSGLSFAIWLSHANRVSRIDVIVSG